MCSCVDVSSPIFQFFEANSSTVVTPFRQTETYLQDWLGLQTLDKAGRLHLYEITCTHLDFPHADCKPFYDKYTRPYLNNTLP
jgi:hypothetical protein